MRAAWRRKRSRRITLRLDDSCARVCNIPAPSDGLEAKFSLRQTVAMALSGIDTASLGAYSAATATDPALVGLREKVALDFQDGWPQAAAEIEVTLGDGRVLRASHDAGIPAPTSPGRASASPPKFDALAAPVVGRPRTRELREAIAGLDRSRMSARWRGSPPRPVTHDWVDQAPPNRRPRPRSRRGAAVCAAASGWVG